MYIVNEANLLVTVLRQSLLCLFSESTCQNSQVTVVTTTREQFSCPGILHTYKLRVLSNFRRLVSLMYETQVDCIIITGSKQTAIIVPI